jgi:hypothetical protein
VIMVIGSAFPPGRRAKLADPESVLIESEPKPWAFSPHTLFITNEIHLASQDAGLLSLENARRFATFAKSTISQEILHACSKYAPARARISILT